MSQRKLKVITEKDIGKMPPGMYLIKKPGRNRVITITGTEDRVDQSQKCHTDLSKILDPARKNQLLRHVSKFEGTYDDIPVQSYQEAMGIVAQAKTMFEELPSHIRSRFGGDPKQFLEFVQNPANAQEMKKLGMLKGNDGMTADLTKSGAPTLTDMDGDRD